MATRRKTGRRSGPRSTSGHPKRKAAPAKRTAAPEPTEFEVWQAQLTPREQRIDEIVGMMSQGQWFAGASHRALARKWGINPGTVEHLAAEANRLLRFVFRSDAEGRKDALARGLQNFEVIRVRAMMIGTAAGLRAAADANEKLLRYLGLEPPKNVRVTNDDDPLDKLTDEQLDEISRDGAVALQRHAGGQGAAGDDVTH